MALPFLETLYDLSREADQVSTSTDALVWLLHAHLVSRGLRSLGATDKPDLDVSSSSERLPSDWRNEAPNVYTLQYVREGERYLVKVIIIGQGLEALVNVIRLSNKNVATLQFNIPDFIGPDISTFKSAFKGLELFKKHLDSGLITFQWDKSESAEDQAKNVTSEADKGETPNKPQTSGEPNIPSRLMEHGGRGGNPWDVGRSDLDPFGGVGVGGVGGMHMRLPRPNRIIDPSTGLPERLPPGAVPPRARFDPFGPSGLGNPRPDHFRPPNDDDYFM